MSCSKDDVKKPLKKEKVEEDDDDDKCLGSLLKNKKKPTSNAGAQSKKHQESKVKKEEKFDQDDDFEGPIVKKTLSKVKDELSTQTSAKKNSAKIDAKKRKNVKEEKENVGKSVEQNGNKRVKKVYDLPGQKRDPPEERDPLRIFYETLYEQVPNSQMAAFWMMEYGLLPKEEAKKVFEKKLKSSQQQKLGSPMKQVVNVKKSGGSVPIKKKVISSSPSPAPKKKTPETKGSSKPSKKRKNDEDSDNESDDDFTLADRRWKKQKKC